MCHVSCAMCQTLLVSLLFVTAGCGYTTRSMVASKYRTIYITPFVNKIDITNQSYVGDKYKIYRPLLETDITKAIINKYLLDGNLKPIQKGTADVVLKGELIDFRRDPLRYTDSDDVAEYRLNLVVNLELVDNKTKETVWTENSFTGEFSYFTSGSTAIPESSAITSAIADLARRVVERTVEQW